MFPDVPPIPELKPVTGWKELPIAECGEPLVPMGPFLTIHPKPGPEDGFIPGQPDVGFSDKIFQDSMYKGERTSSPYKQGELQGALLTNFVREGVAKRLVEAASFLPDDCALLIWDSYRPLTVQKALFDDYRDQLISNGRSSEEAEEEAQKFVSKPSDIPERPSPHNTGGSVDLTIIRFDPEVLPRLKELNEKLKSENWKEQYAADMERLELLRNYSEPLNMGTKFDTAAPETETRFYEKKLEADEALSVEETQILHNRRLLYYVMDRAGISNYPDEWWHFDFGNQFDAIRTGRTAIYGAADYNDVCKEWEQMRRDHYSGTLHLHELYQKNIQPISRVSFQKDKTFLAEAFEAAWEAAHLGNLTVTTHPQGDRLTV